MGHMKRIYTDFVEDTMRLWFPNGTRHLSADELECWYERADSVVLSLVDSYSSNDVLLDTQESKENGDNNELSTDLA